jgi:hypothetical protein
MFTNLLELASLATLGWFALLCALAAEGGNALVGRKPPR